MKVIHGIVYALKIMSTELTVYAYSTTVVDTKTGPLLHIAWEGGRRMDLSSSVFSY